MPPFPLLTLPPEVLAATAEYFRLSELLNLSQCSQRAEDIVKEQCLAFNRQLCVFISIESGCYLELYFRDGDIDLENRIFWNFYHYRNPKCCDLGDPETYRVSGLEIDFCQENHRSQLATAVPTPLKMVLKFAEHLLNLFNASIESVLLTAEAGVSVLGALETIRSTPLKIDHMRVSGRVSHADMRQVLEDFNGIDKTLEFVGAVDRGFVHEKPITASSFIAAPSSWVNRQTLLDSNCRTIWLIDSTLTCEDFNAFLHNWLAGSHPRLEHMQVDFDGDSVSVDDAMRKIFDGLPALPGTPKRQEASSYPSNRPIAYENGMDLRRESDGKMCTLVKDDFFGATRVLFVVWLEPNPNVL